MQDEAININDNFWDISTLQNNKKLYITCLQYNCSISLCFLYDIIYLPDGCEANTITESIIEDQENKLGFNRAYSKFNNFSLMKSLNTFSLTDKSLQNLDNRIPEMKHMSVFSINNTLMKTRSCHIISGHP